MALFSITSCCFRGRGFSSFLLGIHGRQRGNPGTSLLWCCSSPGVPGQLSSCPLCLPALPRVFFTGLFSIKRKDLGGLGLLHLYQNLKSPRVCENFVNSRLYDDNISSFFKCAMYQVLWLSLGTVDRTETVLTFRDLTVL